MSRGLELTSAANPRIKVAVALRDRRTRAKAGLTVVDGARELRRALASGVELVEAFVCESQLAGEDALAVLAALDAHAAPAHRVTPEVLSKLAFGDRAEGLVAVVRAPDLAIARLEPPADGLVIVLEGVEKPGNVGAVLRSADGAGADAVIAADPRTDLANPNVVRASAGTVFAVPTAAASSADVLTWLRGRGLRLITTRVDATLPYTDLDLTGGVAIILGAEDVGLTDIWDGPDVTAVRLPMHGIADSLNVSVTAAILLYEARRQRDRRPPNGAHR